MAMTELWVTPSPSSSFLEGIAFKVLLKRTCILSFQYEGASGDWDSGELRFRDVAAFKCTYLPALTAELIQSAYDKLVEVGSSEWLSDANLVRASSAITTPLRHLRICFDDGPCYEFLCADYEIACGGTSAAAPP
jgi:hypothetical protein